jgi:hypothetical protein
MAELPYVTHPGEGKTSPQLPDEYIDAGTLAALYGLEPGEYETGIEVDAFHIHLFPRPDGKYRSIKLELGDVEGDFYMLPANFKKNKDREYIL